MSRSAHLAALLLLAAVRTADAQHLTGAHPDAAVPSPVVLDHKGRYLQRLARVGDDVLVAGQPNEAALHALPREGVTTVVNLRLPSETQSDFDEATLVKSLGMRYVSLPVDGTAGHPYAPETVRKFAEAMSTANGKVLLHCTIGWRASHLWAAYLISERHVPADSALAQARRINLMDDMGGMGGGRQPVEDFLGRAVPELRRRHGN